MAVSLDEFEKLFKDPGQEFGPTPFFALNSELAPERINRALEEIARAGMAGVFLHPRTGLEIEYLSEEFFARVGEAISSCARLGIKAWLYDEYNWPSGPAGGKLLLAHPEYRQKYLDFLLVKKPQEGKTIKLPGELVAAFSIREGVEPVEMKCRRCEVVLPRMAGQALIFYEAFCQDRMFVNSCAKWLKPSPGYIDLMNPAASAEFIRLTHEQYAQRFSAHFGKTIPGIFTDEPQQYNGFPWSGFFRERFREEYGFDPALKLYLLLLDREDFIKFRIDYYCLAARLMDEGFYTPLSGWCREHGLILTGHLGMEERITQLAVNHGGAYSHLSQMSMPGIDALGVGDGISGGLGNMEAPNYAVKMAAAVAACNGSSRVLCETGGGAGWQMTLYDYKRMCDWLFSQGVNFLNPHHFLLSLKGLRKRDFPPSHSSQEPWFDFYPDFSRYVSRVCGLLSQGRSFAEIAVLIPSSSFQALSRGRGRESGALSLLSGQIEELSRCLMQSQREHDYIFEEAVSKGKVSVEGDRLRMSGSSYEWLLVPAAPVLVQDSVNLIEQFLKQGGKVIFLSPLPTYNEQGESLAAWRERIIAFKERLIIYGDSSTAAAAVVEALARVAPGRLQMAAGGSASVVFCSRKIGDDEIYSLANLSASALRVPCLLQTQKRGLRMFLPWSGESRAMVLERRGERLAFTLDFSPLESIVLLGSAEISESWVQDTELAVTSLDEEKISGYSSMPGARLKAGGKEIKLAVEGPLPEPVRIDGPFEFESLSANIFRLGPWRVKTERVSPLELRLLKDEFFFSRQTRLLVRALRPVVSLLNILFQPASRYRGLCYEDFGGIEHELERASRMLGVDFKRMGLYQTIDTLFRFADYLPLQDLFRVFPPSGVIYQAETDFILEHIPEQLELVFEDLGEPAVVKLNGRELSEEPRRERVWDDDNLVLELVQYVKRGKNHLTFTSKQLSFPCLFPSFHTLEPMVLRGEFEVSGKNTLVAAARSKPAGDLCELGYAHYSGKVKYKAEFSLDSKHLEYYLLLDCGEVREQVEVVVNGRLAGKSIGPVGQFPLNDVAQAGRNRIEIIVSNTGANLLAKPSPSGLFGPVVIWPYWRFAKSKKEVLAGP